ncbi:hypothetical protein [Spiroplasma tabanidicola]|uniref:Uncharacterized protein n=1 Tax=Spiroplasma tabanidicola TaxID=324079 RepID=A0A6I6C6D7_9MOLU|nr:hypothetical protein [Spiroplasma tabanidicola]QGS51730.1 hypothetical protein STABA_v1c03670 [Spiroplasma tabanidicola]
MTNTNDLKSYNNHTYPNEFKKIALFFLLISFVYLIIIGVFISLFWVQLPNYSFNEKLVLIIPIFVLVCIFGTISDCSSTLEFLKIKTINRIKDNTVLKIAFICIWLPILNIMIFYFLLLIKKRMIKAGPYEYKNKISYKFGGFFDNIFGITNKGIAKSILVKGLIASIFIIVFLTAAVLIQTKVIYLDEKITANCISLYIFGLLIHILLIISYLNEYSYICRKSNDQVKDKKYFAIAIYTLFIPILNFVFWSIIAYKKLQEKKVKVLD